MPLYCGFTICSRHSRNSPTLSRTKRELRWRPVAKSSAHARAESSTMTSSAARECYVYITLPGTVDPVTAGKFALDQTRTGVPVGRFVYGRSYLDNPHAVD